MVLGVVPFSRVKRNPRLLLAMGTRNLICVYYKGRFVVAQYSQWDGYPEGQGQGMRILKFLWESANIELLKEGLQYITTLTKEGVEELENSVRQELESQPRDPAAENRYEPLYSLVDKKMVSLWPSLSRDTGAKILEIVTQATAEKRVFIVRDLEFANDGLFCEWAYVVDLDQNTFEVFGGCEGKQIAPTTRFNDVGDSRASVPALIKSFSFSQLPTTEDEFLDAVRQGIKERNSRHGGEDEIEGDEDEEESNEEEESNGEEADKEETTGDMGNTNNGIEAGK
jgi:hypothetical protein